MWKLLFGTMKETDSETLIDLYSKQRDRSWTNVCQWHPLKSSAANIKGKPFVVLSQVGIMMAGLLCLKWKRGLWSDGVNTTLSSASLASRGLRICKWYLEVTLHVLNIKSVLVRAGPCLDWGLLWPINMTMQAWLTVSERFDPSFINLNGNETL